MRFLGNANLGIVRDRSLYRDKTYRLEITSEQRWSASKLVLDLGVVRGGALDPIEESVYVELIIGNVLLNRGSNSSDLWKEAYGKSFPTPFRLVSMITRRFRVGETYGPLTRS
jgi:hypothetical protein